jgi:hypothetical protein
MKKKIKVLASGITLMTTLAFGLFLVQDEGSQLLNKGDTLAKGDSPQYSQLLNRGDTLAKGESLQYSQLLNRGDTW